MARSTRSFITIAENLRRDEISAAERLESARFNANRCSAQMSSIRQNIDSLESQLASAEMAATEAAQEEGGTPDYALIGALRSRISALESDYNRVADEHAGFKAEVRVEQRHLQEIAEEKNETLSEIKDEASVVADSIRSAGGMYGAYAGVGQKLQGRFGDAYSNLQQAAQILGDSLAVVNNGSGGAAGGGTGGHGGIAGSMANRSVATGASNAFIAASAGGSARLSGNTHARPVGANSTSFSSAGTPMSRSTAGVYRSSAGSVVSGRGAGNAAQGFLSEADTGNGASTSLNASQYRSGQASVSGENGFMDSMETIGQGTGGARMRNPETAPEIMDGNGFERVGEFAPGGGVYDPRWDELKEVPFRGGSVQHNQQGNMDSAIGSNGLERAADVATGINTQNGFFGVNETNVGAVSGGVIGGAGAAGNTGTVSGAGATGNTGTVSGAGAAGNTGTVSGAGATGNTATVSGAGAAGNTATNNNGQNTRTFNSPDEYKRYLMLWCENGGYAKHVDFSDFDARVAYDIASAVVEAKKDFPDLNINFIGSINQQVAGIRNEIERDRFACYKDSGWDDSSARQAAKADADYYIKRMKMDDQKGTYAWSLDTGYSGLKEYHGVAFNTEYAADYDYFKNMKKYDVESSWAPVGCDTPRAVADHELGHEIDKLLGASSDEEINKLYNKMKKEEKEGESLSQYAYTNINEFIAEGYSEYRNNSKPREMAKAVYDRLIYLRDKKTNVKKLKLKLKPKGEKGIG